MATTTSNGSKAKTNGNGSGPAVPIAEIGVSGLHHSNGRINEEWIAALDNYRGIRTYSEMQVDAIVGAMMHAITAEIRKVEWDVEPADESGPAKAAAEHVESCMDDMSHTWEDFISEVCTMLGYGWAWHEIVYKIRRGEVEGKPGDSSKYNDGKVGWRKLPLRSQDSLDRFDIDENGGIGGMYQYTTASYPNGQRLSSVLIPIEKSLLFRPEAHKNNPLGRSALRTGYISWYRRKRAMEYEAIGAERDLVGIPKITVPADWLAANASATQKEALEAFKTLGENLRTDEQAYALMPAAYDSNGNKMFDLELMASPGSKIIPIGEMIQRYSQELAMTVLADVILIGHSETGSYALTKEKYDFFTRGLEGWVRSIAAVMNRHAIPRLCQLNKIPLDIVPELKPHPIERIDLKELAAWITALAGAGFPLFPDEELEDWLARVADMPYTPPSERPKIDIPPMPPGMPGAPGTPPMPPGMPPRPGAQQTPAQPPLPAPQPAPAKPPVAKSWEDLFDELDIVKYNHAHDDRGRFASGSGGGAHGKLPKGVKGGDGSEDDPFQTGDIDVAIEQLGQGKYVRLHQPDQVATLVDKLHAVVQDAKAKGKDAPTYDLCKVSVPGTNLFCSQSKHVPRNLMPQLSGIPTPGSWADKHLPKNAKGEVNLGPAFEEYMAKRGIDVTPAKREASHLRATQNQLNGAKVAGMEQALDAGKLPPGSIYVTRDNYVIDGHHRWAANVAYGIEHKNLRFMDVKVVDEDILQVLAIANNFATSHGIPKASVGQMLKADVLATLTAIAKFNPYHDNKGRFSSGSGGGAKQERFTEVAQRMGLPERLPGEADFAWESRALDAVPPDVKHEVLNRVREKPEIDPHTAALAKQWREEHGLVQPNVQINTLTADIDKARKVVADIDSKTSNPNDPEARGAYNDFKRQSEEMYRFMTGPGGIKVDVWDERTMGRNDPYNTAEEQMRDVRDHKHMWVNRGKFFIGDNPKSPTGTNHPFMNEQDYEHFRAVHDVFGHVAAGTGFDRHGEYGAWAMHNSMYSGAGRRAMSTEYHAVNSHLWLTGKPLASNHYGVLLSPELSETNWDQKGNFVRKSWSEQDIADLVEVLDMDPADAGKIDQHLAELGHGHSHGVVASAVPPPLMIEPIGKYNSAHDDHGRFATTGGTRNIGGEDSAAYVRHQARMHGGFTINRSTGDAPSEGYAVAVKPTESLVLDATDLGMSPGKVRSWIGDHESDFAKPGTYMGGWLDTQERKVVLDIVRVHPNTAEGRRMAIEEGKANDQVSIYSLHDGEEIDTGGSGGYRKADKPTVILVDPHDMTDDDIMSFLQQITE